MLLSRKTAIVQFELSSAATEGSLPLACERSFYVILIIEGKTYPAKTFNSPINDEQWRDFIRQLRDCNVHHDDSGDAGARAIKALTRKLYLALAALAPELREFLERSGVPRRLVIQTTRPELHLLPWAAMFDEDGVLLAEGDLSVVQSWKDFSEVSAVIGSQLKLLKVLGADTSRMSAGALANLPPEIEQIDALAAFRSGREVAEIDILHLEQHGDAGLSQVGGVRSSKLGHTFQSAKMALLWSCYSGAADSWGESPALCLHRDGAGLVLSFLAELHNLDAKSISTDFYADVFGPAASRDPESALLRIRCAKVKNEFYAANWASMTVYLRTPLDLSALPLNGPRVPEAGWADSTAAVAPGVVETAASWGDPGAKVAEQVGKLQPGTLNKFEVDSGPIDKLPRYAFKDWRGNVIRLDGVHEPLSDDVIAELNLRVDQAPKTDASDRLVWFFTQIASYGSPLIVWTNPAPHHLDFLKTIQPSSTLTFLMLLYKPGVLVKETEPTIAELVDHNRLQEALAAADKLLPTGALVPAAGCSDGELSAAYFAYARCKMPEQAEAIISRIASPAERFLLSGNFISRFPRVPMLKPEQMVELVPGWTMNQDGGKLPKIERQRYEEDWYRRSMAAASGEETARRDAGRAKHQLGYLLNKQGQKGAAETLFRSALADLKHSPKHGIRWHSALGAVLRDWADLLSGDSARLDEARKLLARAMAVHSFHGRKLEVAYSLTTAAQIALTGCHHTVALNYAVDSANAFEDCVNWDGWGKAIAVMFKCLAETRETARMLALADLASEKLKRALPADKLAAPERNIAYQRALAHWIAGSLSEAREELNTLLVNLLKDDSQAELRREVDRLARFVALPPTK
jgi:hypothetical protein